MNENKLWKKYIWGSRPLILNKIAELPVNEHYDLIDACTKYGINHGCSQEQFQKYDFSLLCTYAKQHLEERERMFSQIGVSFERFKERETA
jgi:hypothetical protein